VLYGGEGKKAKMAKIIDKFVGVLEVVLLLPFIPNIS